MMLLYVHCSFISFFFFFNFSKYLVKKGEGAFSYKALLLLFLKFEKTRNTFYRSFLTLADNRLVFCHSKVSNVTLLVIWDLLLPSVLP